MKLFRQVKCIQRKPQESGNYLTDKGYVDYDSVTKNFFDGEDGETIEDIYYWFEYVEIPTDEEIEQMAVDKHPGIPNPDGDEATQRYNLFQVRRKDGFISGFKTAINHLTGGE